MYDHDCGRWRAYPAGSDFLVDYEQLGTPSLTRQKNGREAWEKFQEQPAGILLNRYQYATNEWVWPISSKSSSHIIFFWPVMMTLSLRGKAIKLGADDYLLKPKRWYWRDKARWRENSIKSEKGAKWRFGHGYSTDLKSHSCSFSRFPVNSWRIWP